MVVDDGGRGGSDDREVGGVGKVGRDDVDGGGRRGVRPLSFRLETGRSPKNRMHLTEGRQEFRKCSSGVSEQGDDGAGEEKRSLLLKRKQLD